MSNAARAITNRENATLSTGPKTEEGKNRSKLNATTHGLASNQTVLPWESREAYEALKASYFENSRPGSSLEEELLGIAVDCLWRLERARRVEGEFLINREKAISAETEGLTGDAAMAFMFADPKESAKFRLVMRYVTAADRAYNKAISEFEKAKKERLRREEELACLEACEEQQALNQQDQPEAELRDSGFVPYAQSEPQAAPAAADPAAHLPTSIAA